MNELIHQLQSFVGNNTILATLTSGSVIVWLVANIKGIFNTTVDIIKTLISFEIINSYEDARSIGWDTQLRQKIFNDLITKSKQIWERSLNLDLNDVTKERIWDGNKYIDSIDPANSLIKRNLTYGFSIRIMNGSIVTCTRQINNNQNKVIISTTLRVFFSSKKRFVKWIDSQIEDKMRELKAIENRRKTISIGYGESYYSEKTKRSMDTIFTNGDVHKNILSEIKKFIDNEKIYNNISYPYKYSALLEGVPGSGKSSTILAIASELGRNIEYINLSSTSMKELLNKLNTDTNKTIYVFEDIDALNTGSTSNREIHREEKNKDKMLQEIGGSESCNESNKLKIDLFSISLSDLLNVTDGLLSSDGAICIFTTNHIERLDAALLRKGRMNGIYKFEYMNGDTAERMVKYHLGHSVGKLKDGIKPAELQESLLNIVLGKETEESLQKFKEV